MVDGQKDKQADRETELQIDGETYTKRQAPRQTVSQRNRKTHGQTDIQTDTHTYSRKLVTRCIRFSIAKGELRPNKRTV